jgi:hypothetical protein
VSVPQAVTSPATRRLAAETSSSWLDLLNFMRIFRQRAEIASPKKLGLESNPWTSTKVAPGIRLRSLKNPILSETWSGMQPSG